MTKPEKVMEKLNNFVNQQNDDFKSLYHKALNMTDNELSQYINAGCPEAIIADIMRDLKTDIIQTTNKSKASKISAAKRILKNADKTRPLYQKSCIKEFEPGKITQAITNNICMVNLAEPLPLPEIDEEEKENYLDVLGVLKPCREYTKELTMPSLADLKAELKQDKALKNYAYGRGNNKVYVYDFYNFNEEDSPIVDLEYLINIVEIVPDGKIYYKNTISPIYITNEIDEAVLCPLRKNVNANNYQGIVKALSNKRDYIVIDTEV